MRGAFLEDLSWPDAGARIAAGAVVVVPVGAAAKEHGPHLPLRTDYLVARELGRRVAEALPVLVAPVVSFGYYPAFVRYPGSQHLRAETFMALVTDVLTGFVRQGARRLAIINTGVSTEAPLRIVVRDFYAAHGVRVAVADLTALGRAVRPRLRQKLGGHADELETSLVLAIEPDAVRMDRAEPDPLSGPPVTAAARAASRRPTRSQLSGGCRHRHAPFTEPGFEQPAKGRVMLQKPVDQVVLLP